MRQRHLGLDRRRRRLVLTAKRTILITGATDGLGLGVANRLANEGHNLILHGRDRARLDSVAAELASRNGGNAPLTVLADLADLSQVRDLSAQVAAITDQLDVLVNNAGIGNGEPDGRERRESANGYELRFAVNYLAGFDLTLRLLPLLRAAGSARIVHVASLGQSPIDFDDVMLERNYDGIHAYTQSKSAQITSGFTLAARLRGEAITVNSLHPATFMPTKIVLLESGRTIDSLETGVTATTRLATAPDVAETTGVFFDRLEPRRANEAAYDPDVRSKLWNLSLELTGAPDPGR
jgi:NAD(P)-dependent dehydrogenase (short-subunit alcohol dehydrogenase family)